MRPAARLLGCLVVAASAATLAWAPAAQAAGPPQAIDTWVTAVAGNGADLRGEINPNGLTTTYRFEYLTETAYLANSPASRFAGALKAPAATTPSIGSGESPVAVLQHVGSLKPATAYRYRLTATNAEATTFGPDKGFTTTEAAPTFSLPDGRAWELVSPVDKSGGDIAAPGELFGGGTLQAAAQGGLATFGSSTPFANPVASPGASQYLASRSAGGWATANITLPTASGAYGDDPDGTPYRLFSSDLSKALLLDPAPCNAGGTCARSYSLRTSSSGALATSPQGQGLALAGATPDLAQVVLSSCSALTANATEVPGADGCDPAFPNLYRWSGGALTLLNILPAASTGTPGASLASQAGAISSDGTRTYFTLAGNLYLREGSVTKQVDDSLGGGGSFEVASADGSIAYLTKAGNLYRYAAASDTATAIDESGEVQGALGASADGSRLYYLRAGALLLAEGGTTTPVAASAEASSIPAATGTARLTPDGRYLAFPSKAPLTGYDNDGHAELFIYDAVTKALTCASCNPTGARAQGDASLPGAVANGSEIQAYKPRALSSDGKRLFFDSADALVPLDTNGDRDTYQWEAQGTGSCAKAGGCINLISSGQSTGGASFADASSDGAEAYFLTAGSLLPQDPGSVDLYLAKVGGGLPVPQGPPACSGDACQAIPPEPEDPGPGTLLQTGLVDPPLSFPREKGKKKSKGKANKKGKGKAKGKAKGNKKGKRAKAGGRRR